MVRLFAIRADSRDPSAISSLSDILSAFIALLPPPSLAFLSPARCCPILHFSSPLPLPYPPNLPHVGEDPRGKGVLILLPSLVYLLVSRKHPLSSRADTRPA